MVASFSVGMDVIIGLVFVFLLVALICSQINDKISNLLRMRAKGLEEGMRRFVAGDPALQELIYDNPLVRTLTPEDGVATQMLEKIPVLNRLIRTKQKPVNIPAQTFRLALFDLLIPNAAGETTVSQLRAAISTLPTNSPMRAPLLSIVSTAENNIGTIRGNIEAWYDNTMDKTTSLYKAHMWRLAFILAALVAVVLNVDTIAVASSFWNDSALRAAVVAEANKYAQGSPEKEKALKDLNALSLPINWQIQYSPKPSDWASQLIPSSIKPNDWLAKPNLPGSETALDLKSGFLKLVGWLITALAGAQGAPFWFDLLRKLTKG